jgi:hypothetical protein
VSLVEAEARGQFEFAEWTRETICVIHDLSRSERTRTRVKCTVNMK